MGYRTPMYTMRCVCMYYDLHQSFICRGCMCTRVHCSATSQSFLCSCSTPCKTMKTTPLPTSRGLLARSTSEILSRNWSKSLVKATRHFRWKLSGWQQSREGQRKMEPIRRGLQAHYLRASSGLRSQPHRRPPNPWRRSVKQQSTWHRGQAFPGGGGRWTRGGWSR